jgi:hypothetical protein
MSALLPILAGCALLPAAEPEKPTPLRYLRPAMDRFVLESEVVTTLTDDGPVTVSRTTRPDEKMTLTLRYDRSGRLAQAEVVQEMKNTKRSAVLILGQDGAQLKRGGVTDFLKDVPAEPVVTTAPDWSDVFQLVRRYDGAKGGKQEYRGLWIHPVQDTRPLTFAVERVGGDSVTVKEKDKEVAVKLDRYRVTLRSGDYLAWTDPSRRVVRLVPASGKGDPVVLQGFEEATRSLAP